MSGSLTWREYESDHGTIYSIRTDKSNARLLCAFTGEALINVRGANWELPPKTLVLRRLHCVAQFNLSVKRSFVVGNRKAISLSNLRIGQEYLVDQNSTAGALDIGVWIITGYTGEKFTCPKYINQIDSGLTDGTPLD